METIIEVLKDGFKMLFAMFWFVLGLMCCFGVFLIGGVGNSKDPELETIIGISLTLFAPFWVAITIKISDKKIPK